MCLGIKLGLFYAYYLISLRNFEVGERAIPPSVRPSRSRLGASASGADGHGWHDGPAATEGGVARRQRALVPVTARPLLGLGDEGGPGELHVRVRKEQGGLALFRSPQSFYFI